MSIWRCCPHGLLDGRVNAVSPVSLILLPIELTGPISVLVTTNVLPNSTEAQAVLNSIHDLRQTSSTRRKLSVHLLHLSPGTPENPNAYLNLARVFAPTSSVALFPGNLSVAPPKTFQRSFSSLSLSGKPVVFSTRGKTAFPFSPLSPVVLDRDDPVWCTERFLPGGSRSADWTECLWQIWLENFGAVDVRPTTDWVNEAPSDNKGVSVEVSDATQIAVQDYV